MPNTTHNYSDSDGDYREMTLAGHCDDLEDCVKHFMDQDSFSAPLILAGHSAGGYSALNVSSRLPKQYRPALTIASAPLISGSKFLRRTVNAVADLTDMHPDKIARIWADKGFVTTNSDSGPDNLELHWSVMADWSKHDLARNNIRPQNPTILIGGEEDTSMPPEDIHAYADAVGLNNVHFIENGDHCYTEAMDEFEAVLEQEVKRHFDLS